MTIAPEHVHGVLGQHMLVDGFDLVCDLTKSHGCWLHDAKSGKDYLDMFTFFATLPLGFNHPKLTEPSFVKKLARAAVNKVSNSDVYTVEFAEAVDAFDRYAIPPSLPHLFFIDGGALAVENCLKAAFDWKVQKNFARGIKEERGHQVIHFKHAFHGRSGYTLSLTNTADPRKHQYFPKFPWPRIDPPTLQFPLTKTNLEATKVAEEKAVQDILSALAHHPHDIAALIIEPIQAEGGDRHFRPEFLKTLRHLCDEHEMMLIFDEVQTGFGLTGKMWAYEHWDVVPDLLAFGKKAQICGALCGQRIDDIPHNVFQEPSRINSTFGGNIVDLVRVGKILEIMHADRLLEQATSMGTYLLKKLEELQKENDRFSNARGLGLMCAIDLPTTHERDRLREQCYHDGLIILSCGTRSLRFRPALTVEQPELDQAIEMLKKALMHISKRGS